MKYLGSLLVLCCVSLPACSQTSAEPWDLDKGGKPVTVDLYIDVNFQIDSRR